MANENVIKARYRIAGLATMTCKILKPDDTVRDGQTAVPVNDTGHVNVYSNPGAVTVEAGDTIAFYIGAASVGGYEFRPETRNNAAAIAALFASTGVTVGGTMTYQQMLQIRSAWGAGTWRDKSGSPGVYELLDPDNDSVVLTITISETTPQRSIEVGL